MSDCPISWRLARRWSFLFPAGLRRWLRFNAVGLLGIGIQLVSLTALKQYAGLHYLAATALAVESAILHNFIWHNHWTWADRKAARKGSVIVLLGKFNLSNGAISIVGNLLLMGLLVGLLDIQYLAANLMAIMACSLVNFLICDRFVFGRRPTAPLKDAKF
jgi:putative flippase GtrA